MLNRVITVDPGDNSGWAYWNGTDCPDYGVISLKGKEKEYEDVDKLALLSLRFSTLLRQFRPEHVVLEGINLWGGSAQSMASASRGNSFYVAYLVGAYLHCAVQARAQTRIMTVQQWKGQLPKEEVIRRVRLINGIVYPNHIADAVGIGFSIQGRL